MSKVNKLKTMLKKMLEVFANVSTDKGLLSYASEGELPELGENVYIVDEEGNEEAAPNGEYRTEGDMVIVVEDGKVAEIRDEKPAPEPEPEAEEVEVEAEEIEIVEPAEPEPVNEEVESIPEPEANPFEERIAALEARLAAAEARLAALEAEPAVESAEETFKAVNGLKRTGDEKMDRLNKVLSATRK